MRTYWKLGGHSELDLVAETEALNAAVDIVSKARLYAMGRNRPVRDKLDHVIQHLRDRQFAVLNEVIGS